MAAITDALNVSLWGAMDLAERQRQESALLRQNAYEDDYGEELKARVKATFTGANAEDLLKVLDTTNNVLKRVTNQISVLYEDAPTRALSSPAATRDWRDLLDASGADVVFPQINRLVNLQNELLLYIRPGYDSLSLRPVLPHDYTVIADPNDPTMPLWVEFRECNASTGHKPVYHQFDRRPGSAGYRKFDEHYRKIEEQPPQYFDEGGRPLIPCLMLHRVFPVTGRDTTSGNDLYELTMMVGMWETWINHLLRTDSYRQKYVTGEADVSTPQEGGSNSVLQFRPLQGGSLNVGEFSSQADWMGIGQQVERKFRNVLDANGLVLPDTRTSGDPTSGFALTVRSQGLMKIQRAQKPVYARSERTFYRIYSAVWNFERRNPAFPMIEGPELPPYSVAKPSIKFADIETLKTVEERRTDLECDEREIAMGIASPITVYIKRNPEATEEEARAAIAKNKADADALKPEPKPMPAPFGQPRISPDEMPEEEMHDEADGDAPPRK